ncbi:ER-derived vesicles protein ERV41 [Cyphellophora attinorum]|uniref:Endoplasmic reticulum-Golgi intermediate compartment protein n=1 Tax=Cyphellophora attinorum TaxID=1664694 RepID=A0A0N1HUM1_9EURO|nr:ER-derived vesicles protein ERV41 [Phialophora attinorum]KPI40687.1 ER-derived vesicles protein ERV41 [Phialophora attinorum]
MGEFDSHGLDEDAFGENPALSALKTFDAFPKVKSTYTSQSARGGQFTLALIILCTLLTFTELRTWWNGTETHHFSVERGVGHELQLNLDIIVAMQCTDLHVNVQDAAMDRIIAGDLLIKEPTNYALWTTHSRKASTAYQTVNQRTPDRKLAEEEDSHVAHVLGHMRENPTRKFTKSPKIPKHTPLDTCRIYGSLEGNKVQGDFHITARGHGYMEFGQPSHLEHNAFNFSHHINELSFGPHYLNLLNPLDKTTSATDANFYKYQYYLSIVPTIFTKRRITTPSGTLDPAAIPQPPTLDLQPATKIDKDGTVHHVANPAFRQSSHHNSIFTNQYAAQSQSREVNHSTIPGVFFKYDIEPILLIVAEQRSGFLALLIRLVNVMSGVVVGGGWVFS